MKLVIEISNTTYEQLAKIANDGKEPLGFFERTILNGTPLPKGGCISRQAAIDGIKMLHDVAWKKWHEPTLSVDTVLDMIKGLPSAQSEPIRINLNDPIKVKLTDYGKEIYYHQYEWLNPIAGKESYKPMLPKEDENGYTEFQLWRFMELYGEHMGMIEPNVIMPLEIVYWTDKEVEDEQI